MSTRLGTNTFRGTILCLPTNFQNDPYEGALEIRLSVIVVQTLNPLDHVPELILLVLTITRIPYHNI